MIPAPHVLVFFVSWAHIVNLYALPTLGHMNNENPQYNICVRSRTGFVVTFANFPILWVSKLQEDIALSTLHSEYVTLSRFVRDSIPLKCLIKEVIDILGIDINNLKFVSSSTVYNDNNGAIVMATSPSMTPKSNHIFIKYPWFRQNVGEEFVIQKIDSENQKADIFTKGLQG